MAELEFTQGDIEALTRKLATLEPFFSNQERALLLAIFAAAAERAESYSAHGGILPQAASPGQAAGPGAGTGQPASLPLLQQQLLCAYIPGNSFDSVTHGGLMDRITGRPGSIGASPPAVQGEGQPAPPSAAGSTEPAQPDLTS